MTEQWNGKREWMNIKVFTDGNRRHSFAPLTRLALHPSRTEQDSPVCNTFRRSCYSSYIKTPDERLDFPSAIQPCRNEMFSIRPPAQMLQKSISKTYRSKKASAKHRFFRPINHLATNIPRVGNETPHHTSHQVIRLIQ